jgi:hypothetical protein
MKEDKEWKQHFEQNMNTMNTLLCHLSLKMSLLSFKDWLMIHWENISMILWSYIWIIYWYIQKIWEHIANMCTKYWRSSRRKLCMWKSQKQIQNSEN